ncbi:MAG: hypothetical protein V6S10_08210 [Candidatus Methanoglobus sp.]
MATTRRKKIENREKGSRIRFGVTLRAIPSHLLFTIPTKTRV